MTDPAVQQSRLQQQVEELCVAAIRAMAGEPDLHFRGRRLHRGRQRLPYWAPHLHPALDSDDFGSFRGAADALALRLRHSDPSLHAGLQPARAVERMLFDLLEQLRCESLYDEVHRGVARNLRHRHEAWCAQFEGSGLVETTRGLLLYALVLTVRSRISDEPMPEPAADLIESARGALAPLIGPALGRLRPVRHDQAAFGQHALAIARAIGALLQAADDSGRPAAQRARDDAARPALQLLLDPDADGTGGIAAADTRDAQMPAEPAGGYRVFTRAYDRELRPGLLLQPEVLAGHRQRLDRRVAGQGANVPRLARALQALLAVPLDDGWDAAQEQGRVDGRRLARLVAVPTERRLFRTERPSPQVHAALTLLVDCSGSMKAHAESVAMMADILLRAAEGAGLRTELLGFSTGAWQGGRAARDWQRAGRPPRPGRVAELTHLVFKDGDTPWQHARRGIAALLEPTLFREGVDGEAVAWACDRLRAQDVRHRLLLVVSDGCPMESATRLANDDPVLEAHLCEVVAQQEARGEVAICGVGVGLDLSLYYPRSRVIDLAGPPGNAVFGELLQLMGGGRRR